MSFLYPQYLWYSLFLLPYMALLPFYYRRQLNVLHLLCRRNLSTEMRAAYRRYLFFLAFFAALFVLALVFALAKPLWGYNSKVEPQMKNLQIVFVLDISRSMLARDVLPSRLDRGVELLGELYEMFQSDELGLVVFKGRPQTLVPLSRDRLLFPSLFPQLDSEILQAPGSNISSAVIEAIKLFDNKSNASKIIILLSDGESLNGELASAQHRLDSWDGTLMSVGIGTEEGRELFDRDGTLLTNYHGLPVHSKLQDHILKDFSRRTFGKYYRIQELNLAQKLQNELLPLTSGTYILQYNLRERYQLFIHLALVSFVALALFKRFGFMGFYRFVQGRRMAWEGDWQQKNYPENKPQNRVRADVISKPRVPNN